MEEGEANLIKTRKIGIWNATYKELWNYAEEMTVVKRFEDNKQLEDDMSVIDED
jgi:hypothetical protein